VGGCGWRVGVESLTRLVGTGVNPVESDGAVGRWLPVIVGDWLLVLEEAGDLVPGEVD
jgi:hypothetical protein